MYSNNKRAVIYFQVIAFLFKVRVYSKGAQTKRDTHLSLRRGDGGPARVDLLVDGGQEVLGDPQSVLEQREVRVVLRCVL